MGENEPTSLEIAMVECYTLSDATIKKYSLENQTNRPIFAAQID